MSKESTRVEQNAYKWLSSSLTERGRVAGLSFHGTTFGQWGIKEYYWENSFIHSSIQCLLPTYFVKEDDIPGDETDWDKKKTQGKFGWQQSLAAFKQNE